MVSLRFWNDVRRRSAASIIGSGLAFVLLAAASSTAPCQTPDAAPATTSDAIRVLAREQSAAEAYAVVLQTHGKRDIARYVQGITRYAEAKAEFDGLIEQLKFDLGAGRDPQQSPQFAEVLNAAANKRIAFSSFVVNDVLGDVQGAKPALPAVIAAVPILTKALTDVGGAIWKEYRTASKERRDDIRSQLDRLKWRPFADIAAKG
jgi:hypothetical protein